MTSRYLTTTKMAWARKPLNRRIFTLLTLALFVAFGATAFVDVAPWVSFVIVGLGLLCFWFVYVGVRAIPDTWARDLDERQLKIRNSDFFFAWQLNTGLLFVLLVILAIQPEWLSLSDAISPENFWLAVALIVSGTPFFVMGLREREI